MLKHLPELLTISLLLLKIMSNLLGDITLLLVGVEEILSITQYKKIKKELYALQQNKYQWGIITPLVRFFLILVLSLNITIVITLKNAGVKTIPTYIIQSTISLYVRA